MAPLKRFIRWSLIAHIIVLIVGFIVSMWQHKTNFIVFGAHSRYDAKPVHHTLFAGKRGGGFGGGKKQQVKSGKKSTKKQAKKAQKQAKKAAPIKKQRARKTKKSRVQEIAPVPEEHEAKPKPKIKIKRKKKRNAPVDAPIIEKPNPEPEPERKPEQEPELESAPEQQEPETEIEIDEVAPPELEVDERESSDGESGDPEDDTAHPDPSTGSGVNAVEGDERGFSVDGEDDPAALARYQKHVQHEIDRVWRPPVGVPQGTLCTVQFIVADDGSVASCTFVTRSKVLIYDLSIMRIATQLHFNKSLWGKRFVIGFKQ